uniref:Uncharacterized protein n=1 Tax=Chromera velia CCMP2878 TaxID=1169474 RepID=A0A0G4HW18_9ALVE|eukprot:Cvel_8964.t1-p1 / transcript=Cvel_8964.t1 / gene=Cvel_8964 / organism=Chromera_velia_CCMP2878 / gene_product=hypothetical protein / transcript_product=hypothetical protein / location=Cvel_scaffold505:51242-52938(-) / protein_length=512 / sequence_SO=supercontig / SO=protein_coding / is_pseudo=false
MDCVEAGVDQICFLTSLPHWKQTLRCHRDGTVDTCENKLGWEELRVQKVKHFTESDGRVTIQSCLSGRFLKSTPCGSIETTHKTEEAHTDTESHASMQGAEAERCPNPFASEHWFVTRIEGGGCLIQSVEHQRFLRCHPDGRLDLGPKTAWEGDESETWRVEDARGFLVFLSHENDERYIGCNIFGHLFETPDAKGWEVWRFSSVEHGVFSITSLTHEKRLGAHPDGHVFSTDKMWGWEHWVLETEGDRIFIMQVPHAQNLSDRWVTTGELPGECDLLASRSHQPKHLLHLPHKYRIVREATQALCIPPKRAGSLFHMAQGGVGKPHNNHGVAFVSASHPTLALTLSDSTFSLQTADISNDSQKFSLSACLPITITGSQIFSLSFLGAATISLAVAAPFAVAGVVALMGFEAGGIAAGSVAAGMMSAEAIATGGAIVAGGTVATLQSIGAAGLGVAYYTAAAIGTGAALGGVAGGIAVGLTGVPQEQEAEARGSGLEGLVGGVVAHIAASRP